ncbi:MULTISPECIES: extracellular catalytic domain type 1 short-chain-length polyhydroxyalkanoate depolymerase [unclassified Janthinobacterium]|uniref:extracellular catalytic domain type 1 short-chain-length polyhydroxyalkanoate depolymerase n=1 Tax=unclassified Janthinobacterium TaxID=2610881 RepID=UPI0003459C1E|nr:MULTISPECIES: PHB depolymerase family esterase [unclassified Janthinobacterium]MEC5160189.1 poly(3-hydroxybutyrate) depolymerase [Janthinobacterium sp. CG_S6]
MPRDSAASNSDNRLYSLYVPSSYRAGARVPLVVSLHGCRQSDLAMLEKSRMHEVAEAEGFIVLYPFVNTNADGTGPNDDDLRNPNCWGYWMARERQRGNGEVHDIKRMVDKVAREFSIDPGRVHITGVSSGAAMANIAQVAYPDVFASAVFVEGIAFNETTQTYTGQQDCATVLRSPQTSWNRDAAAIVAEMRREMGKSVLRQAPVMVVHNAKDCTVPISVGMNLVKTWANLLAADGKAIDTSAPNEAPLASNTDGLAWTHSKYGRGANNLSLLETFLIDATSEQVAAAGVVALAHDPYAPDSDVALREERLRGHWWAGGERGPWIIDKGPNLARVAWTFFKTHPMQGQSIPASGSWRQITDPSLLGILTDTWLYVPTNAPLNAGKPAGRRALMLALPGCGQSASGHVINKGFNWEATAEKYGMVVVAATKPNTPRSGSGKISGSACFDWFDEAPHSRGNRDAGPLLNLVDKLKQMPELAIDPRQVYVSGLSAGGGEAQLLACLAPDVFSGVGLGEAPTLGSPASLAVRTPRQVRELCGRHAASFAGALDKQVVSLACGDSSILVPHCASTLEAYLLMWNANTADPTVDVAGGAGGNGRFTAFRDAAHKVRIGDLRVPGMKHAWPAGPGGSKHGDAGTWIDNTRVNFPEHLTKFLFDNNQWYIDTGAPGAPTVACAKPVATALSSPVRVECTGSDNGSVVSLRLVIANAAGGEAVNQRVNGASVGADYPLADGAYTIRVDATDNEGLTSAPFSKTIQVGALASVECKTDRNKDHVLAARANNYLGAVFAAGSGGYLGWYFSTTPASLQKTASGDWIKVATCPAP